MAICLPGIASRVKRAPTSATRAAPFVTTVSWMTTRIAKTTRPMTSEPPMTMWPKASMTWPAYPSRSTSRVDDTASASRRIVPTSTTVGKTANSSGLRTCIATSSTSSAIAMLPAMSTSSRAAGSGTTIMITTTTTTIGTASLAIRLDGMQEPPRKGVYRRGRPWRPCRVGSSRRHLEPPPRAATLSRPPAPPLAPLGQIDSRPFGRMMRWRCRSGDPRGRKDVMQVLVALVALPFVALLLALASRLEDGLRARATARSDPRAARPDRGAGRRRARATRWCRSGSPRHRRRPSEADRPRQTRPRQTRRRRSGHSSRDAVVLAGACSSKGIGTDQRRQQ